MLVVLRLHLVIQILFWRMLGKRLRAKYRLEEAVAALPFATERRMARDGKRDLANLPEQKRDESCSISIHLHVDRDADAQQVHGALSALLKQSHQASQILVTLEKGAFDTPSTVSTVQVLEGYFGSRAEGLHAALQEASDSNSDWLVPTLPSFTLPRHAIASFAAEFYALQAQDDVAIVYGDQGELFPWWSPTRFWLKPQYDDRMFLSQDYVTDACAINVERALSVWPINSTELFTSLYEVALALSARSRVVHLDRVVVRTPPEHWQKTDARQSYALERLLGDRADISRGPYGSMQVRWTLPERLPSVSVIVATRDRVELLRACVEGVLNSTDYPTLDLIIADNESMEPETLAYMGEVSTDTRVQVIRWPHPFNYSAINNFAAAHAKGEFLCLLNNDIEITDPDWLMEMVREACQPGVGAVGARLLYPDRTIQHAGVAVGIGNAAGHAHRGLAEGEPGYFAQVHIARGASAVTAACLLVRKEHFYAVGGLDEDQLAVAYNDVDFCLKLRELGLSNIYTPAATLIHHESKSRGLDFAPEHLERYLQELEVFQERWNTTQLVDPWHHHYLDRNAEQY